MKKLLTIAGLLISTLLFSQAPQSIHYQAVIRDANGAVLSNQSIDLKVEILQGPNTYTEIQTLTTNNLGLVNFDIGTMPAPNSIPFTDIDWAGGNASLLTWYDPTNTQSNWQFIGSSSLASVPYALYAENGFSGDFNDLTNVPNLDTSNTNELQVLSLSGDTLFLSNGGFVVMPSDDDKDSTNELQHLFVRNDSIFLSKDTIGSGAPLGSNPSRTILPLNFQNCISVDYVDSLSFPIPFSMSKNKFFIQEVTSAGGGKYVIFSSIDGNTIVLDSLGYRHTTLNIPLFYDEIFARYPAFNNNVVYRDSPYFVGIRAGNTDGDTIGSNIITATKYVLVLNEYGFYQSHFSLDSLSNNGKTKIRISAINGNLVYIQCNSGTEVYTRILDINNGTANTNGSFNSKLPMFTQTNRYWLDLSLNGDSTIAYFKDQNGSLIFSSNSSPSEYIFYFFNYLKRYESGLNPVSFPNRKISALFNIVGEFCSNRNSGFSYIDSNFIWQDIPSFNTFTGSSDFTHNGLVTYVKNDDIFIIRSPLQNLWFGNGGGNLVYLNDRMPVGQFEQSRLQVSFNTQTKWISNLTVETAIDDLSPLHLTTGNAYYGGYFQGFSNFVIAPYGSRMCFNSASDGKFLIFDKDSFEELFIH